MPLVRRVAGNLLMANPIVSIVLPTFNRMEFLPATIESVLAQTMTDWELIIADDGSDRDTRSYLDSLTSHPRVRLLRLEHSGNPGTARNAGIAAARGTLLAFLDSDDLWAPTKLERQLAALRANPECRWSYTAFVIVDAGGIPLSSERNRPWIPHSGQVFAEVVRTNVSIRLPSVVASAELVREAGGFDETIDRSEDYDLWMRLALRSPICIVDEQLLRVRRHASNENRQPGSAHIARDHSLRKLAEQLTGAERELLAQERSRNALQLAAVLTAHNQRWRAVTAICGSLSFAWRYPHWWYGAAKELAKAVVRSSARAR